MRQKTLKLAKAKTALAASKRKADQSLRFKLGGLVISAGLAGWDEATLRGALLAIAAVKDAAKLAGWRDAGGRAYNAEIQARKAETVALSVTFPAQPSSTVTTALRAKGLAWAADRGCWAGQGIPTEIAALAAPEGGVVSAIASPS